MSTNKYRLVKDIVHNMSTSCKLKAYIYTGYWKSHVAFSVHYIVKDQIGTRFPEYTKSGVYTNFNMKWLGSGISFSQNLFHALTNNQLVALSPRMHVPATFPAK